MDKEKELHSILETSDVEKIHLLEDQLPFFNLSKSEKEGLALLFVRRGRQELALGDGNAAKSFLLANQVAPHSTTVLLAEALAYGSQKSNFPFLRRSSEILEGILAIEPENEEVWRLLGAILTDIGKNFHKKEVFSKANECFEKALAFSRDRVAEEKAMLFRDWGRLWFCSGTQSGEAMDYRESILNFKKAIQMGVKDRTFLEEYADALYELALLTESDCLMQEAIGIYVEIIGNDPRCTSISYKIALAYRHLYKKSGNEKFFVCAQQAFENATDFYIEDAGFWRAFGELLFEAGSVTNSIPRLRESYYKFTKALSIEPENSAILASYGRALVNGGKLEDSLELLKQGEAKLVQALEIIPEDPLMWYLFGTALMEIGRYFSDVRYLQRAIDKFHFGLSLNNRVGLLWYALASAHTTLGEILQDPKEIKKAISYFEKTDDYMDRLPPSILNEWGVALMKLGEFTGGRQNVELAAKKFEEIFEGLGQGAAAELYPNPDWFFHYGCTLDYLGDLYDDPKYYERAQQVFQHTLKLDPDYTPARYNLALSSAHMGELLHDLDSFLRAIEHFQLALLSDAENEMLWNDYGLSILQLSQLIVDPFKADTVKKLQVHAEEKFLQAASLGCQYAFYNLACFYSLTGNFTASLHFLERAKEVNATPPVDDILHDEWLEAVRDTPGFRAFIGRIVQKKESD